uniref:Thyroid transcription factor 1-associated protein 26 n=1 Tax=Cyprinus carpio carpio TaxID=630221 RepID=A0A9J8ATJ7_CYPCA
MAPLKQNAKSKGPIRGKCFNNKFAHGGLSHNAKRKRKWVPENKVFDGGLKEGQGFAFKRKEKIKHEYNKLLRKERKKMQASKIQLEEEYPEHLRHLYLAERERLDEEEQEKKKKRCKGRAVDEETEADDELKTVLDSPFTEKHISNTTTDKTTASDSANEPAESDRKQKQKMSSYQKTKQEYERIKEERARKREEFLKDKAQREEALKKYKEKKTATYQLLKRKTKKGQPNLNLHMELLLQKIEAQRK